MKMIGGISRISCGATGGVANKIMPVGTETVVVPTGVLVIVCRAGRLVRRFHYHEGRQDRIRVGRENYNLRRRQDIHDALQRTARVQVDEGPASGVNLIGDSKLVALGATRPAAVLGNIDAAVPVGKQPINLIGQRR